MKPLQLVYVVLLIFLMVGCKSLDTKLVVAERNVPGNFNTTSSDTNTVARIHWRQFFSDTSLAQLIDIALDSNIDLYMAFQRIEIARSGVKFSTGNLLPGIAARSSAGRTDYAKYTQEYAGNVTTFYDGNKVVPNPLNDFNMGLLASWEIDIWGKLRNQRKSAIANYLASIEGKNFLVSTLVANIALAYYELLAFDNELEIVRQTIQRQQEAFDFIRLQKEVGRVNELAVQQFQAQLLNSYALEKETLQQITETENKINFLLGRFPQRINRNKEVLFIEIPSQISSGIPSQMLSLRPDIREAERHLQASKFDLKTAKASFLPNVNISAALGFQAFNARYLFNYPVSVGSSVLGGLAGPIINRNALKQQFNLAKANQLNAMYNYQKTILNAYMEVFNELSKIQNLKEIISLKKQENEVLQNSVETSKELFKTAKANYLEVLMAQQNSLKTKLQLIEVQKRQQIATVNIYRALGGGW